MAALTALIGIIGSWSPSPVGSTLWSLPAALLLLGLAYESRVAARSRVKLVIAAPARWFLGRPATLSLGFRHALDRVLVMEIAPSAPDDFSLDGALRTLTVPASASVGENLHCTPRRLGLHVWPAMNIRVRGVLGLASWPQVVKDECTVRVDPELLRHEPRADGVGAIGARSGRRLGAGAELLQLRPYQPGDSPRVIDWKATARARRLISRDFSEDQHLEIVILIDAGRASGLGAGELDRFGHYINAAARLAQRAASLDDLVGLVIFADRPLLELPPARGIPAMMRIRSCLSAAHVERGESNPLHAAVRVRSLVRHRSLVVILTDMDDATVAGQLAAAVRMLLPKHLPFIAGLASKAAETLTRSPAHGWLDPYRALAAQEYCISLERKVRALRALGAPALVAMPDQLERAVFDAYSSFRRLRRV
jgi:uncharacterized protein (DUF58 family)